MEQIIISILRIASVLCTCNGNNTWYLCDLQENKDALVIAMDELKDTRDDVQKQVVEAENNPNEPMECKTEVRGWLKRVQAIEGEVMKVILKADKEIKGRCIGGYCSINCWNRYEIGKLVTQRLAIVKDLKTKGSFVSVAHKLSPPLVQIEPVDSTVGMESMFEKAWRLIGEDEVRIFGLYGQGGVGKTTLLKQINNVFHQSTTSSSSNLQGFDVVIFVVVSKVINIDAIQKEIGSRLGLSSPDGRSIFNALKKKSFVLLLDDIWDRVDLQSIGVPSPSENNKSKVVFTTRSEVVCGLMDANEIFKVECLPWNEARSLFEGKVGERALKSFPRARELAEVVARECGGLPLALITIGRAMSTKRTPHEWNHAITKLRTSASRFPGMGDIVLPKLKLSYDHLSDDTIKSCFLYCALFPEDHSIYIPELIDYWIGEGLISFNEFDHIDEARNQGYDIIGNLKGACLLESGGDDETEVKMHDTIRDLALWIAHECGSSSKRDKVCIIETYDLTAERSSSWYNNAERIYLIPAPPPHNGVTDEVGPSPPPLKSPNLITLIYHHFRSGYRYLNGLPQNFFEFTPLLRVLDLSNSGMKTFPMSITELLELRYLSLSSTEIKELPKELGKLVKLNFLDLSHMWCLDKIPSGVISGSLLELRVLNLLESYSVHWDLDEVHKLKHLNDLRIIVYTQHSNLTKLLSSSNKNLQMCTRHLLLTKDQLSEDKPQSTSSLSSIITLEKLQLLFNLETLRLELLKADQLMNMVGIEQQQHLGSSCFQNLIQIEISSCNSLKDITWAGYVNNLKTLHVYFCYGIEEIVILVDDFGGTGGDGISTKMMNIVDIFKSLKTLTMRNLPRLKSICRNALVFPCLESMNVSLCPQLKKLPLDYGSNVNNTLQKIQGKQKWWNELRWGEEDHDNNELLKSKFLPYFRKY